MTTTDSRSLPQDLCTDFYGRLEQIQSVRHILSQDVRRLENLIGTAPVEIDSESAGIRRHYVRAVFALIEAIAEQHRLLLLELSAAQIIALDESVAVRLRNKRL